MPSARAKEGVPAPRPPLTSIPGFSIAFDCPGSAGTFGCPWASRYESTRFPPLLVRRPRAEGVAEVAVAVGCGGRGRRAHCSVIAAGSNLTYLPIRKCGIRASRACRSSHCASTESSRAASSAVNSEVDPTGCGLSCVAAPTPSVPRAAAWASRSASGVRAIHPTGSARCSRRRAALTCLSASQPGLPCEAAT
jgi:hypothetical protein